MKRNDVPNLSFKANRVTMIILIATTVLAVAVSILSLSLGYFVVFQNLFYFPIIVACVYYTKRGLVFSAIIAVFYFILTLAFTRDSSTLIQAFIRVIIFVLVAAVITYLSLLRQRTEIKLRESEVRYKTLFESASEGILIADIATKKLKYANPSICKMLGYSREELLKMSVSDIHPKDSLEYVMAEFNAQARGEKVLALLPCLKRDGMIIYADISATKAIIDGRECNIGFFTDATERIKAEELIRTSLAEKEAMVKELQGAIDKIKTLSGLIPICAWCKKVRDDKGYWQTVEQYMSEHSQAEFTHSMCPDCEKKYFPQKE